MIDAIVARLNTGTISSVVRFGVSTLPSPPYVCVKPEIHPGGRGVRVIAHTGIDEANILDDYIFNEVSTLLKDYEFTDSNGNSLVVKDADEYTEVMADNDDNTISMERLFYVPSRLH